MSVPGYHSASVLMAWISASSRCRSIDESAPLPPPTRLGLRAMPEPAHRRNRQTRRRLADAPPDKRCRTRACRLIEVCLPVFSRRRSQPFLARRSIKVNTVFRVTVRRLAKTFQTSVTVGFAAGPNDVRDAPSWVSDRAGNFDGIGFAMMVLVLRKLAGASSSLSSRRSKFLTYACGRRQWFFAQNETRLAPSPVACGTRSTTGNYSP